MSKEHGTIGMIKVRTAILKNACVRTDCKWHTCHWKGLYENGCYMLKDNSMCIDGIKSGFIPLTEGNNEERH